MSDYDEVKRFDQLRSERIHLHSELGDCKDCPANHWFRGCDLPFGCMKEPREEAPHADS